MLFSGHSIIHWYNQPLILSISVCLQGQDRGLPIKPGGTTAAPPAQVQRLNNRKHVHYINIFADSDLSIGNKGLHNRLSAEDVTPDVARKTRRPFRESFGANGSCGSGSSSGGSVLGEISYQPGGLISTESLYHTSHLWTLTRGQHTTPDYQKPPISLKEVDEGLMVEEMIYSVRSF